MKIIKAQHLGMCFGVRDAISLALTEVKKQPITVLGDLVHNETVLANLRARGIRIAQAANEVKTGMVMITAHGASQKTMDRAKSKGHAVLEATCPLVHAAHRAVARLVQEGFHPIIIGKRDHVEVRGLTEDLYEFDVVLAREDVETLRPRPRFGIAAQTTQPLEKVQLLTGLIRSRFPLSEVCLVDTVCHPTKQRQNAAVEVAKASDIVIVAGGAHSNNTHELVQTCARHCPRVYHVQSARQLQPEWFSPSSVVGLTAGTSTPDSSIAEIEDWLMALSERLRPLLTRDEQSTHSDSNAAAA